MRRPVHIVGSGWTRGMSNTQHGILGERVIVRKGVAMRPLSEIAFQGAMILFHFLLRILHSQE